MNKVLAIDFGASSGRAVIGELDGDKIKLTEIHRFSNDPVTISCKAGSTMHWDFLRLLHEIKQSLIKSKEYGEIDSLAIDTWGVDFGLLDKDGRLLENPVHYRDGRTAGMTKYAERFISSKRLYEKTGIQIMEINTAFQLLSLAKNRPDLLERADKLLLMPDLFSYFLGGSATAEMSIASTTQLFDAEKKTWSDGCIEKLGINRSLLPDIVQSGTVTGTLSRDICEELDIKPMKIIAVCGHDTQSALAAVPAAENDFAFLSCGTWSLLGTELESPVIDDKSAELNVSNETCYGAKTSLLKNIIGLWLIQESRRQWIREGTQYSYAELEQAAKESEPFRCFIDPDSPEFTPAGNIPQRIREYCERTGQYVPQSVGEIMRCIYESLALKYRCAITELEQCTGKHFKKLYMVGGGTKDRFLSELTACSVGIEVSAGPVEATALGNIAVQLIALGALSDIDTARRIIANSETLYTFTPKDSAKWNDAFRRYTEILKKGKNNA